jgi:hypothetical protein
MHHGFTMPSGQQTKQQQPQQIKFEVLLRDFEKSQKHLCVEVNFRIPSLEFA